MIEHWRPIARTQTIVAQDFQLPRRLMQERDKTDEACIMRQTAFFVAWMVSPGRSISLIAQKFERDASTFRYGIKMTFERMMVDAVFSARVRRLVDEVRASNPSARMPIATNVD